MSTSELSELEQLAEEWMREPKEDLVYWLCRREIQLTAANEQIGALRWEVEHERRERRRLELQFCKGTR